MKVRASDFDHPDFEKPGYSLMQVDYYASIPFIERTFVEENHRLSLRRNLKTGRFEAVKYFWNKKIDTVVFEGTIEEVVQFCNRETEKYYPGRELDLIEREGLL